MALPAWAGNLGGAAEDDMAYGRIVWSLALCLVLAIAAAFFLRHRLGTDLFGAFGSARVRRLKLVEQLRISPQASLVIVTCDDQELLLVSSDKGTQLLAQLPFERSGA